MIPISLAASACAQANSSSAAEVLLGRVVLTDDGVPLIVPPPRTAVSGDQPYDVATARAVNAVGVASGKDSIPDGWIAALERASERGNLANPFGLVTDLQAFGEIAVALQTSDRELTVSYRLLGELAFDSRTLELPDLASSVRPLTKLAAAPLAYLPERFVVAVENACRGLSFDEVDRWDFELIVPLDQFLARAGRSCLPPDLDSNAVKTQRQILAPEFEAAAANSPPGLRGESLLPWFVERMLVDVELADELVGEAVSATLSLGSTEFDMAQLLSVSSLYQPQFSLAPVSARDLTALDAYRFNWVLDVASDDAVNVFLSVDVLRLSDNLQAAVPGSLGSVVKAWVLDPLAKSDEFRELGLPGAKAAADFGPTLTALAQARSSARAIANGVECAAPFSAADQATVFGGGNSVLIAALAVIEALCDRRLDLVAASAAFFDPAHPGKLGQREFGAVLACAIRELRGEPQANEPLGKVQVTFLPASDAAVVETLALADLWPLLTALAAWTGESCSAALFGYEAKELLGE